MEARYPPVFAGILRFLCLLVVMWFRATDTPVPLWNIS